MFLHQLDHKMRELGANAGPSTEDATHRRNPVYQQIDHALSRSRGKRGTNPDRQARRALRALLTRLEKDRHRTPDSVAETRHQTTRGDVRSADDVVILVNGTKPAAADSKPLSATPLAHRGRPLSAAKTRMPAWSPPRHLLGDDIQGSRRRRGGQSMARLSIPQEQTRAVSGERQQVSSSPHIPARDALLALSDQYRGWGNSSTYANAPHRVCTQGARATGWGYAHLLARKPKRSMASMLAWARQAGRAKTGSTGKSRRRTFTIPGGTKARSLAMFPPHTGVIHAGPNQENWTADLQPVTRTNWRQGRSAATQLTALARRGGTGARWGLNLAEHAHHKNRMTPKRTLFAQIMSDTDQKEQARALGQTCHLEHF